MTRLLLVALLAAFLFSCVSVDGEILRITVTPVPRAPDFTVLAKSTYAAGADSKAGKYVTIMLFGARSETQVSDECYERAVVGAVLTPACR